MIPSIPSLILQKTKLYLDQILQFILHEKQVVIKLEY